MLSKSSRRMLMLCQWTMVSLLATATIAQDAKTVSSVAGWPTYMRDNGRSGQSDEHLTLPLHENWSYQTRYPLAPAWPLPAKQNFWRGQTDLPPRVAFDRAMHAVSDGQHVLFGSSSTDRIICLEIATGAVAWSYTTEGPIRFAPALDNGHAFVGSDDGHVYCLRIATGELAWKFRAGPRDHRLPGNGRLISMWPIRSGVIIDQGHVRFAAGLFPNQGTYQYALDAGSGKRLAEGKLSISPQGYMQLQGSAIKISQGRAPATVLATLDGVRQTDVERVKGISADYPFAWISTADHLIGGGDGQVAVFTTGGEQVWRAEVLGRAYGLAVASGRLLVSTDQGCVYCFGSSRRQGDTAGIRREENAPRAVSAAAHETVRFLTSHFKDQRGYALLLGDVDPQVTRTLVQTTDWQVVCRQETSDQVDATRADLDAVQLASRSAVHQGGSVPLPYGSGLFNAVIVPGGSKTLGPAAIGEVVRVLRPAGGVALIRLPGDRLPTGKTKWWLSGIAQQDDYRVQVADRNGVWLVITRQPIRGAGEWTHLYASASNTACSDDEQINDQLTLQWFGQPGPREMVDRHHRTVAPLMCSGRLFVPGNERVYAVDAYNGTLLWEVEIPGSRRVAIASDCGSMVATPDTLYVAAGSGCRRFDASSGQALTTLEVPATGDQGARDWGFVAAEGDLLFGSTTRPGAARSGHSKQQISEAYYDAVPVVTSDAVFAVQRQTGQQRWQYRAVAGAIVNSTITIGGGRLYFVESGNPETLRVVNGRIRLNQLAGTGKATVVAVDAADGTVAWRSPIDLGKVEHHLFLSYAKEKLILVGTRNQTVGARAFVWYDTHCVNAVDGKPIWMATQNQQQPAGGSHGEQDHHPVIVGDTVYVEPFAYQLDTGQRSESWSLGRGGHGCGSISASAKMCFFRAGNPTMCELASGAKTKVTRVNRPGCWINIIPAGGLVLIPEASSGCVCDYPIQASMAFASPALARPDDGSQ